MEIKFGAATLSSGALSGYAYFTMGVYNDTAINWVIIGRHSSTTSGATIAEYAMSLADWENETPYGSIFQQWLENELEVTTPAGAAVDLEWDKQEIFVTKSNYSSINLTLSSEEVVNDDDLDSGEILVISEKNICNSSFGSNHNYEASTLKSKMTSFFESDLGFTDAQKKLIMPQYLKNLYGGTSYTSNAYLFPLAGRGENFNVGTYLDATHRISYSANTQTPANWMLRSGHSSSSYPLYAYYVYADGSIGGYDGGDDTVTKSYGVRPAFVLKLT